MEWLGGGHHGVSLVKNSNSAKLNHVIGCATVFTESVTSDFADEHVSWVSPTNKMVCIVLFQKIWFRKLPTRGGIAIVLINEH